MCLSWCFSFSFLFKMSFLFFSFIHCTVALMRDEEVFCTSGMSKRNGCRKRKTSQERKTTEDWLFVFQKPFCVCERLTDFFLSFFHTSFVKQSHWPFLCSSPYTHRIAHITTSYNERRKTWRKKATSKADGQGSPHWRGNWWFVDLPPPNSPYQNSYLHIWMLFLFHLI